MAVEIQMIFTDRYHGDYRITPDPERITGRWREEADGSMSIEYIPQSPTSEFVHTYSEIPLLGLFRQSRGTEVITWVPQPPVWIHEDDITFYDIYGGSNGSA